MSDVIYGLMFGLAAIGVCVLAFMVTHAFCVVIDAKSRSEWNRESIRKVFDRINAIEEKMKERGDT